MNFLIFGAGAIGTYLGASLAQAGLPVSVYARPATAAHLRANGFRLNGAPVSSINIFDSLPAALNSAPDAILFALKAYDTANAIRDLRAVTTAPPLMVCLQNGIGNEAALVQAFGAERVLAGTVTTAVARRVAGDVQVERARGVGVALGHPLSERLLTTLRQAGLNAQSYASADALKWSKLLTNLVGNATSAILDMTVAEIFADTRLFALEMRMLRECLAVMHKKNYAVVDLPSTPVRALAMGTRLPAWLARPLLVRGVARGRGGKMPSFHIDLHSGQQTEVNWLNGAVVRHGAEAGVPTPVNQLLTQTLEDLSTGLQPRDAFRRQPAQLLQRLNG
ncbi:MAG: ketopantoate reductase family protein [Anaerolineales bacterium]|nr:ketopantoate reductase family protein [Anaerolineales bacterium]